MKYFFVFSTLLLIRLHAHAQFNDSVHHHVGVTATGIINKTDNSRSYLFNNGLRYSIKKKALELNAAGTWIYGENNERKTNNDYSAATDVNFLKDIRRLYYWALFSYEKSFSLKLDHRVQMGAGLGYTFFNREKFKLVITDGLLYESSKLLEEDKYGREAYKTLRNSLRLKYSCTFGNILSLEGSNFLQQSLSDKDDYILKTSNSLLLKVYKSLSLTATFTYNRFNLTGTENLLLNYGLSWDNYF